MDIIVGHKCNNNHITSFQHLPNNVNELYCNNNQITNFQHLQNDVTKL